MVSLINCPIYLYNLRTSLKHLLNFILDRFPICYRIFTPSLQKIRPRHNFPLPTYPSSHSLITTQRRTSLFTQCTRRLTAARSLAHAPQQEPAQTHRAPLDVHSSTRMAPRLSSRLKLGGQRAECLTSYCLIHPSIHSCLAVLSRILSVGRSE